MTPAIDQWLRQTVLTSTPIHQGDDTPLWNRDLLADLIKKTFDVTVDGSTVGLHLHALKLSYQKPAYRDVKRDEQEVETFLNKKFPKIQELARKMGADRGFEDEAGVSVTTRSGKTWGAVGHPPEIPVSMERKRYNILSMITAQGTLEYTVTTSTVDSEQSIQFLFELIDKRPHPFILLTDRVSFHESKAVRDFDRAHRQKLRIFFLPKGAPELNPDEQVWNEIKNNQIGKQLKNKKNLGQRIFDAMKSLQGRVDRIKSFFQLPETKYASDGVG
jgi:transposase